MRAILVDRENRLVWSPVPDPVLKPDEVLVKIEYAAPTVILRQPKQA